MRSFFQYIMTYRHKQPPDEAARLAEWVFHDHDFPRHSSDYNQISHYLEFNSPFPTAVKVFDELWEDYQS